MRSEVKFTSKFTQKISQTFFTSRRSSMLINNKINQISTEIIYTIVRLLNHFSFAFYSATAQHELSEATETGQIFSFSLYLSGGLRRLAFCVAAKKRKEKLSDDEWMSKDVKFPIDLFTALYDDGQSTVMAICLSIIDEWTSDTGSFIIMLYGVRFL